MPALNVTVSLSEVLEARGAALSEAELWAVLCQGAETIQDLFITEQAVNEYGPAFVVNPDTVSITATGQVEFGDAHRVRQYVNYMAPETEEGFVMTPTAVEKIYVYALGKSLVYSAEYRLRADQQTSRGETVRKKPLSVSRPLESLLGSMMDKNSSDRMPLVKVLEGCSLQAERQSRGRMSFSHTVLDLYRSVMGVAGQEELIHDSTYGSDKSRQMTTAPEHRTERSRRKHRRSSNSDRSRTKEKQHKYRSRSRSRSRSSSYSRSRSKRHGRGRTDSPDSGYHRDTPLLIGQLAFDDEMGDLHAGRPRHLTDITASAAQNGQVPKDKAGRHNKSSKRPPQSGHRSGQTNGQGSRGSRRDPENPALKKYVKLKERQRKLRALRSGVADDDASDELSDIVMDHMSEARSVMSLASYSQGAYHPDMHLKYGSNMALKIGRDPDRDSITSSEMSVVNDPHALRANGDISDPYIQQLQQLTSAPPPPTLHAPPPHTRHKQPTAHHAPPVHEKHKDFYGPEFVHRSTKPIQRIPIPLLGESRKNPGRVCRVVVVLLNGQKLEAMCDPSMTGQQLFEAVVTNIELPEFYFFGLTYISDGEHFFLDQETKLHKVAPDGWRDSWKGQNLSVTFTVHLRVKFYTDSISTIKHQTTRHLLYLQLRRDVLEERCLCDEDKELSLAGLALQAEYGRYNPDTMGRNYFIPEHYFSGRTQRRLGSGYIRDHTPEAHMDVSSLTEAEAETEFIKLVQEQVPEYGIHFHKLLKKKSELSGVIWVGVNSNHMVLAEASGQQRIIVHRFPWMDILKISFNRRRFSVQPRPDMGQFKPVKMNFYTNTYRKGQYLLKFCTAQHSFQLKMKSRLTPDPATGMEDEAGSIGAADDVQHYSGEEEGLDSHSNREVQALTGAAVGRSADRAVRTGDAGVRSFPAKDYVPQKQPIMYKNPPPYRPDSSASMIDLPSPDAQRVRNVHVATPRAATVSNIHAVGTDTADEEDNMGDAFVPTQAYVIDMSTQSMDQTIRSPPVNETISNTLNQRFKNELLSPEPVCEREVFESVLRKQPRYGIGITIVGGDSNSKLDLGIFIKSVTAGGPAAADGRIKPGDKLIAINDISLEGMQHHSAVQMIKDSPEEVKLLISQVRAPGSIRKRDYDDAITKPKRQSTCGSYSDLEIQSSPHVDDSSTMPVITVEQCPPVYSCPDVTLVVDSALVDAEGVDGRLAEEIRVDTGIPEPVLENSATVEIHSTLSQVDSLHSEMVVPELPADLTDYESSGTDSDFDDAIEAVTTDQQMAMPSPAEKIESPKSRITSSNSSRSEGSVATQDEVFEVCLEKQPGGSFGLNVTGGVNTSVRYGGIYVKSVVAGSVADIEGAIRKGDRILKVDQVSLEGYTHKEAVESLRDAPTSCRLLIQRDAVPLSRRSSASSHQSRRSVDTAQSHFTPTEHVRLHSQSLEETQNTEEKTGSSLVTVSEQDQSGSGLGSIDVFEISQETPVTDVETVTSVKSLESVPVSDVETAVSVKSLESAPTESVAVLEMSVETADTYSQSDLMTAVDRLYDKFVTQDNTYTVDLKKGSRGLGFSVAGGRSFGQTDPRQCVTRIKRIFPIGPAADSNKIKPGDVILEVNGREMQGMTHAETMETLRRVGGHVQLLMCRPDQTQLPPLLHRDSEESLVLTPTSSTSNVSQADDSSDDTDTDIQSEETRPPREVLITPPTGFAPPPHPTDNDGYIIPKVASPPPPLPQSPPPTLMRSDSLSPIGTDVEVEVGVASLVDSCRSEIVLIQATRGSCEDLETTPVVREEDQSYSDSREATPFSGDATPVVEVSPGDSGEIENVRLEKLDSVSSLSDDSSSTPASVIDKSQTMESPRQPVQTPDPVDSDSDLESESSFDVVKCDTEQSTSFMEDTGALVPDIQLDMGDSALLDSDEPETSCEQYPGVDYTLNKSDELGAESESDDSEAESEKLEDNLRRLEEKYNLQEEEEYVSDEFESDDDDDDKSSSSETSSVRQKMSPTQDEEELLKTGEYEVTLSKPEGKGLGFTVAGGAATTQGCYIKAVLQNPALSDGTLKSGDKLLKVNGMDMTSLSHFDAVTVLREACNPVTIRVYRAVPGTRSLEGTQTASSSGGSSLVQSQTDTQATQEQATPVSNVYENEEEEEENREEEGKEEEEKEESSSESDSSQSSSEEDSEGKTPAQGVEEVTSDPDIEGMVPDPDLPGSLKGGRVLGDTGEPSLQQELEEAGLMSTFTVSQTETEPPTHSPRKASETSIYHIDLDKPASSGVGIGLVTAEKGNQTAIFIRTVTPDGVADRDGRLCAGDKLLMINGYSLVGMHHNKAANILRNTEGRVVLTVSRKKGKTPSWFEEEEEGQRLDLEPQTEVKGHGDESSEEDGAVDQEEASLSCHVFDDEDDDGVDDLVAEARRVLQVADDFDLQNNSIKLDEFTTQATQDEEHHSREHHQYLSAAETIDLPQDKLQLEIDDTGTELSADVGRSVSGDADEQVLVGEGSSGTQLQPDVEKSADSDSEPGAEGGVELICWCDTVRKLDIDVPEEVTSEWLDSLSVVTVPEDVTASIPDVIAELQEKLENEELLEEFKQLRNIRPTDSCQAANKAHNKSKNRFRNVLPYDENRVVLSGPEDTDYINASHINHEIEGSSFAYIACQGPLPTTTDDFWKMVWEHEVTVIVMLTLDMEAKKVKCHRYWPESVDTPLEVCDGKLRLSLLYLNTVEGLDIRNVLIEDTRTGESLSVVHLNYTAWPDHGVPESALPLLQCMRLAHLLRTASPVVVHCSAGIGRTGTFITIDLALSHVEKGLKFDIHELVRELRRQRQGMIQTRDQYTFCYMACIEALLTG